MTTLTLPPPVIEPKRRDYAGKDRRLREVNYFIDGTEATDDRGTERKAVQVTVGHSGSSKEFYARANQVTIRVEPGLGVSTSFWLFNGVSLQRRPVARYNAKALDAFFDEIVAVFPDLVAYTPKLQAMFTDTDGDAP